MTRGRDMGRRGTMAAGSFFWMTPVDLQIVNLCSELTVHNHA